jgi:predicted dehydrogenase
MCKLKVAIIGCRNMGQKHLKTLREDFADQVEIAGILNVQTDKKEYEYKATAERWPKKEVIVRLSFFYFIRAG